MSRVWIECSRTGSLLSEWIFNLNSKQTIPLLALATSIANCISNCGCWHYHVLLVPLWWCLDDVHQNPWMPSASIEDWLVSRRSTTVKSAATPRVTTCTRSRWCLHPVGALWQWRHAKSLEDLLRSLCPSEGYHGLLPRISRAVRQGAVAEVLCACIRDEAKLSGAILPAIAGGKGADLGRTGQRWSVWLEDRQQAGA